jgi:hypothetical protein
MNGPAMPLEDDDLDVAKQRRRHGQSWFNGRRGVRNFLLLAVVLVVGSLVAVLMLPLDLSCALLPESWRTGPCSAH